MFRVKVFLVIYLTLFVFFGLAQSQTQVVGGEVAGIWSKEKSPYVVMDDITVMRNRQLIIQPGVHVYFQKGTSLTIGERLNTKNNKHQLLAIGSKSDSIVFAAKNPDDGWEGLRFIESSDDDTIAYAIIKDINWDGDAWYSYGAIEISLTSPSIFNSIIKNNAIHSFPLLNCNYANLQIENCIITNNITLPDRPAGEWGPPFIEQSLFNCDNSNIRVENTLIYDNKISRFINGSNGSLFTFINMTITKNEFKLMRREYMINTIPKKIYIYNSIITNNETDVHNLYGVTNAGDSVFFNYSNIDTSIEFSPILWEYDTWRNNFYTNWESGNIFADPMFVDVDNNNFTLQPRSPCVDAGHPNSVYNDNEDPSNPGQALWPAQGTVRNDMGAYGGNSALMPMMQPSLITPERLSEYPSEYVLFENYPNPFNPETNIEYCLPMKTKVTITIHNTLGQPINTLVNSEQPAGTHKIVWDGRDMFGNTVSSGVYFYQIKAGEFRQVKKMTVVR